MTNTKTTKRSLLASVMALFLCFTMLLGTTFAWFTDSVTSANNIIKAGNLDIELYHSDKAVTDEKVGESTKLFDEVALWEPGVMVWEELTVKNEGDLALKYQLTLNVLEATEIDGVSFASMLKVALVEDGFVYNRENVEAIAADEWQDLATFTLADKLDKTENEVYGIVIWWQPSDNDNLFNMNNGNKGKEVSVKVGVTLVATQLDAENDAFGNDYDAGLTPPDEEGNILVEKDGIQYYYTVDGEYLLYLVTEDYAEETVVVPEGVTSIGNYAFSKNTNVKEVILSSSVKNLGRGFDSSTVERVVLNEGLEQIDSRAFRSTPNLKEVVISSTVKTIADNAFQKSGIKEIVIPASVKTIGEAAFGSSLIETVTFEGDIAIQGYAFRGCTKLSTVNMNGYNVTFIASTLNNRNSCWFCNGESNNPNTSNITFNVKTDVIKDRVLAAMGAEKNNTPVNVEMTDAVYVNDAAGLEKAVKAGAKAVILAEGDYALRFTNNTNFNLNDMTIKGLGDVNLAISSSEAWYGRVQGSNVTFENIHFTSSVGATGKATYNNCTFDSWAICASSNKEETTFNNCTINGCLNTSTDFSSGDVFVNNCIIAKAEYSGSMTMNFVNCQIGEIIIWNADTNLTNCQVTTLDTSNVTNATVTIK